jgi:RNA polymerase sigma factor (sigma-70 family)
MVIGKLGQRRDVLVFPSVRRLGAVMAEQRATVFVVDDDVSVRRAIEAMLRSVGLRVETFASTQRFLERRPAAGPSCLILDVRLPGVSGLDFQRQLADAKIEIPIVFVTGYGDIPMTVRAMKAGAVEFLTKPFRDQDLLDAVQHALDRDRLRRLRQEQSAQLRQRFETLTKREREVLQLVVSGKLNREIAARLGTSEITVKIHRGRAMRKMGAKSAIELASMAQKLGVVGEL